jgi:hypothetical protein
MVVINNSRIELNDQKFENLAIFSEKIFCAMSDERGWSWRIILVADVIW